MGCGQSTPVRPDRGVVQFKATGSRRLPTPVEILAALPASTPADTQQAIVAEVTRVGQLAPAEFARLGTKYTDAEALWTALDALNGSATLILRASDLKKRRGGRLPKRGTPLPAEAIITVNELREIHAKSRAEHALPIIALSQSATRHSRTRPPAMSGLGFSPRHRPHPCSCSLCVTRQLLAHQGGSRPQRGDA